MPTNFSIIYFYFFVLDEFSSVGSDKDYQCSVYNVPIISDCNGDSEKVVLGHCRALYEYSAKVYDELNLRIGKLRKKAVFYAL